MDEEKHPVDGGGGDKKGGGGKSGVWLTVIGIGKLIKVAVLVAVGIGALVAVNDGSPEVLRRVAGVFGVEQGSQHLQRLIAKVAGVSPKKLAEVGVGSFVYAAVFATEGIGLLLKKKWAEYLTIVITTSFLPLEIYGIVHEASAAKVVTLVLNVVVLVYLVVRVLKGRAHRARRPAHGRLGIASH